MTATTDAPAPPGPPTLDLRSGGWVIVLAVGALLGVVGWLARASHQGPGRGLTLDVDLATAIVARDTLVVATTPDTLPPLETTTPLGADAAERLALPEHARNLMPSDSVIGVAIGGEARAYPI